MSGPRWPVVVAVFLALVLLASIVLAGIKTADPASTLIDPCAAVLTRDQPQGCR